VVDHDGQDRHAAQAVERRMVAERVRRDRVHQLLH
jgi:hypothetical protein